MSAVSNTTPLRHLIAIGEERILPILFGEIVVPRIVHDELTHPRTPQKVSGFLKSPPVWYRIHEVPLVHRIHFPMNLDRGEQEAIVLAEFLSADLLLIDDRIGRSVALSRNLLISGTLGVLQAADTLGFLNDFPQVLAKLKASGFYLSGSLEQELILGHRNRHGSK